MLIVTELRAIIYIIYRLYKYLTIIYLQPIFLSAYTIFSEKVVWADNFLYLCKGCKYSDNKMYKIYVKSIPITNIEDRDKEIIIKGSSVTFQYGSMIKRSFRIDDDMMSTIFDSGDAAIKVFRYIKSHTNSQTNKVILKASDVIEYLNNYKIKSDASTISKGIKKLISIKFIIKSNTLEVYKNDASNVYLVNPNYCIISSPDTVFRRIQSDERAEYDSKIILNLDKQRAKRKENVIKLKNNRNGHKD